METVTLTNEELQAKIDEAVQAAVKTATAETLKAAQKESQEQVDAMLAKLADANKGNEALQLQLDEAKKLNNKSRLTLQEQLDMQAREYQGQLTAQEEAAKKWQTEHHNLLTRNAIMEAATNHKAVSATQLQGLLAGMVQVTEQDGVMRPTITHKVDSKGEMVEVTESVDEYVARMASDESNYNLFQSTIKGGTGGDHHEGADFAESDILYNQEAAQKFLADQGAQEGMVGL